MDTEKNTDNLSKTSNHASFEQVNNEGVERTYQLKSELGLAGVVIRPLFSLYLVSVGWQTVTLEMNPPHIAFATLATYTGLIVGATTWITLFLAGVFGIAAGGAKDFITLCSLLACLGFGVGGKWYNILYAMLNHVKHRTGALYLEHIPQSHQWTLTLLSIWWAFGQLVASLIGWAFIANFSCPNTTIPGECKPENNQGWRYTMYTLGALTLAMFICRYFIFDLRESSKFLIAKGRDEEAIEVSQLPSLLHLAARKAA
ncbi:hypothetical protein Clacol_002937 [Clathrus columnatus]|uniref:Transmembrane protein n=1 Tax=Clathrus columnatus TaxID=1419009 RepID=A0AAV5A5G7_9AGAM|nr:hypothetical protein Clacol_002937 [Clathrus columnatus]